MESKNLYLVIVNKTAHYYVRCSYSTVTNYRNMLLDVGESDNVVFHQLNMSDFDEINHNHFC